MTRPRIGVAPCFFHADPQRLIFKGKTLLYLEESLSHWLQRGGALPLMLPTPSAGLTARDLLAEVDGLVLRAAPTSAPAATARSRCARSGAATPSATRTRSSWCASAWRPTSPCSASAAACSS